jgi:uroporphyrinogen-III synthase
MSLAERSIVVTRPRGQVEGLVAEIEARGGTAVVAPMISIVDPVSWVECDRAIAALESFDALVFSSTNGVEKFFGRCREKGVRAEQVSRLLTYAVGEKTRQAIQSQGARVEFVPEDFSSGALGKYFSFQTLTGRTFLLVRGDIGKKEIEEILRDRGAMVSTAVVYRTVPVAEADSLRRQLSAGKISALTFASPSAVRRFRQLFPDFRKADRQIIVAVIGPTTEQAARAEDLVPDIVAPQATPASLVQALDDYFSNQV